MVQRLESGSWCLSVSVILQHPSVFHCHVSKYASPSDVLEPAVSNADVTYWLNYHGIDERRTHKYGAINTAIEATTLNSRTFRLHPQDKFIRDNIQQDDVLIVSVGGNDIALAPTPCTIMSLLCLPHMCMEQSCVLGTVPVSLLQNSCILTVGVFGI